MAFAEQSNLVCKEELVADFETIGDGHKRLAVEGLVEMQLSCQRGACLLQREIAAEGEVEDRGENTCGRREDGTFRIREKIQVPATQEEVEVNYKITWQK